MRGFTRAFDLPATSLGGYIGTGAQYSSGKAYAFSTGMLSETQATKNDHMVLSVSNIKDTFILVIEKVPG